MNEETFNLSIRKFLKMVGVNSQREIEQAVAKATADRTISGTEIVSGENDARGRRPEVEGEFRRRNQPAMKRPRNDDDSNCVV